MTQQTVFWLQLFLLTVVPLGIFIMILGLEIPGLWKFVLVVIEMLLVGHVLTKKYNLETQMGLILLRSSAGLELIDRLAKRKEIFTFLADAGTFMCYGFLSLLLMRKNASLKSAATGFAFLTLLVFLVVPTIFPFLSTVIKTHDIGKIASEVKGGVASELLVSLGTALLYLGGIFLMLVLSIVWYGIVVLIGLYNQLTGVPGAQTPEPGGTFLLPGVNLPLLEGLLALVIIMAVHETAHAVLARIAKNRVLSSGIILFGILPVGAFVEPDERELEKLEKTKQSRVLVAGSTSNLIFSVVFFLLFAVVAVTTTWLSLMKIVAIAPIVKFVYITLGLTFALNFIVGSVNLLPLPFFDGYRVIDVNVDNKIVVKGLMYIVLGAFIMNFLPWLFKP